MMTGQVILLVSVILGAQALIWIPIIIWSRRKAARLKRSLNEMIAVSGENTLVQPEGVTYSKGGESIVVVRTSAVAALTDKRLLVLPYVGGPVDIPLADIVEVTENKWFKGEYRNGRMNAIMKLKDGQEVAIMSLDHQMWMGALQSKVAAREA